jgi:hypothetical protein
MGANLYHLAKPNVNGNDAVCIDLPPTVSGNYLAHNKYDAIGKAFLAADLYRGRMQLIRPTLTQAARLARTNYGYAWWAVKRQSERAKIEAGRLPLVPPVPKNPTEITDAELIDAFRKVGVEHAFDVLVEAAR